MWALTASYSCPHACDLLLCLPCHDGLSPSGAISHNTLSSIGPFWSRCSITETESDEYRHWTSVLLITLNTSHVWGRRGCMVFRSVDQIQGHTSTYWATVPTQYQHFTCSNKRQRLNLNILRTRPNCMFVVYCQEMPSLISVPHMNTYPMGFLGQELWRPVLTILTLQGVNHGSSTGLCWIHEACRLFTLSLCYWFFGQLYVSLLSVIPATAVIFPRNSVLSWVFSPKIQQGS